MKCLVVTAHPLSASLCSTFTEQVVRQLKDMGHDVDVEDLYAQGFEPALTIAERESYYAQTYSVTAVQAQIDRLLQAEALVLVFPTWWFGFPAILKGWFDRVWAPSFAYDHAGDLGPIKARLTRLEKVLVITTLGSPWWVDWFILRQPVKKIIKWALLGTCAPKAKLVMLSLYKSESLSEQRVIHFSARIKGVLAKWKSS